MLLFQCLEGNIIIQFREFRLEDKPIIDSYFKERRYEQSECCFTTLFMWQYPYEIQWAEENNVLYIRSGRGKKQFWLPPFSRKDAHFVDGLERAQEWFRENKYPFLIKGADLNVVERMKKFCPDCYEFTPDRDNFEYIYATQDLINLSGKKFRQKKNHLNYFHTHYSNYEYLPIDEALFPACLAATNEWFTQHEDSESLEDERIGIELMFKHWDTLNLTGGAIRLFGKIEAFTIGEMLNEDMALIHIEKANPEIRGIYQVINNDFVRHAWNHTQYINREEDMGIPGLRQAKEGYNPVKFAEKYDAVLAKGCAVK